jgi:hypothetical protein
LGGVSLAVGFWAVMLLSNWDIEGTLDEKLETTWGAVVLVGARLGNGVALLCGMGLVVFSRGWGGRIAGLLITLLGMFGLLAATMGF